MGMGTDGAPDAAAQTHSAAPSLVSAPGAAVGSMVAQPEQMSLPVLLGAQPQPIPHAQAPTDPFAAAAADAAAARSEPADTTTGRAPPGIAAPVVTNIDTASPPLAHRPGVEPRARAARHAAPAAAGPPSPVPQRSPADSAARPGAPPPNNAQPTHSQELSVRPAQPPQLGRVAPADARIAAVLNEHPAAMALPVSATVAATVSARAAQAGPVVRAGHATMPGGAPSADTTAVVMPNRTAMRNVPGRADLPAVHDVPDLPGAPGAPTVPRAKGAPPHRTGADTPPLHAVAAVPHAPAHSSPSRQLAQPAPSPAWRSHPAAGTNHAAHAAPNAAAQAAAREAAAPRVHIGVIEITIEAPPPVAGPAPAVRALASDLGSRHYLRRL